MLKRDIGLRVINIRARVSWRRILKISRSVMKWNGFNTAVQMNPIFVFWAQYWAWYHCMKFCASVIF